MVLSVVVRLGQDNVVLRSIAVAGNRQAKRILGHATRNTLVAGLVVLVFLTIGMKPLSQLVFSSPTARLLVLLGGILALVISLLQLCSEALRGRDRILASTWISGLSVPTTLLVLLFLLRVDSARSVMLAHVLAVAIALVMGVFLFLRFTAPAPPSESDLESSRNRLTTISLPFLGIALMATAQAWLDTLIVAFFRPDTEVGLYGVAARISRTIPIALLAINLVVAPQLARLHETGDLRRQKRFLLKACLISTAATVPICLVVLIFAPQILGLFGPEFGQARLALMFLVLGQMVNGVTGPVGTFLLMANREKSFRNGMTVAVAASVVTSFVLVRILGFEGVAIATAFGIASQNLIAVYLVVRVFSTSGGSSTIRDD